MKASSEKWVARGVRASVACGVLIGPGADALPLLAIWISGYLAIAVENGFKIDEDFIKGFVSAMFIGFVEWYVSGEIAQVVIAVLAGALLPAMLPIPLVGPVLALIAYLGSNAVINGLFTYRFLHASAEIAENAQKADQLVAEKAREYISHQVLRSSGIADDLVKMFKAIFS